ncbi:hypothetical protein Q5P01_015931 [Channa striata]|uniref:Uncharacterized protein n=1 Tax=Channa striata TaxID=64152 RepID=A0AA88MFP6_CHASR|nr:hypothetical protein Q5P01_015931 [Channa striata]
MGGLAVTEEGKRLQRGGMLPWQQLTFGSVRSLVFQCPARHRSRGRDLNTGEESGAESSDHRGGKEVYEGGERWRENDSLRQRSSSSLLSHQKC